MQVSPDAVQLRDSALYAEAAISVRLCAAMDGLCAQLQRRQEWIDRLAGAFWQMPVPPIPLGSLPINRIDTGPTTGYFWAIQRITVGPIGATSDLVHLYKSHTGNEQQPQTALNTLAGTNSAAGAFLTWNPGRTGCLLLPDERVGVAGTITGANPVMNWEVIQGELWALPLFLV
jgi:hypothetical protein